MKNKKENIDKHKEKKNKRKEIVDLVIFTFCVFFFFRYICNIKVVPTGSMSPAIQAGDIAITSPVPYWFGAPKRGDIVTFYHEDLKKTLVKRVVGLPCEKIEFKENQVYIDSKLLEEPYIGEEVVTKGWFVSSLEMPENGYFVMGDNREHSTDSRFFKEKCILGDSIETKVLFVIRTSKLKQWFEE